MSRPGLRIVAVMAVFGLAIGMRPGSAMAQSGRDLREENQRLQTQVNDLQAELAAARQQLADLQKQIDSLKQQLQARPAPATTPAVPPASSPATTPGTTPLPPPPSSREPAEKLSIDETIPNASPRALFRAVQENYKSVLGKMSPGDDVTKDGLKQRAAYVAALQDWIGGANRQFRLTIDWTVVRTDLQPIPPDALSMELQAVDPQTQARLGKPFIVTITKSQMDKLRTVQNRESLGLLTLRGVAEPRIAVNYDLLNPGPFDEYRFIGPYADFGYSVKVKSLTAGEPSTTPAPEPHKPQPR